MKLEQRGERRDHAEFKVGSIIKSADDIQTEQTVTFFLFKVIIGRAFVR